jgi:hypothetical protein
MLENIGLILLELWNAWVRFLEFIFSHFDTWLGFLGLVFGLIAAAGFGWPPLRSALLGLASGIALVVLINVVVPKPAICLQQSKSWDILRAYSLKCPDPNAALLPKR